MIDDLRSPDTFDTRLGERASANVTPCLIRISFSTSFLRACAFFSCPQRKGQEGYDPDFDEESTMVEDSVTPSK